MPLDVSQVVDGNSPIPAASVVQFYNLLVGLMDDQPVTLRREVAIGGDQASGVTELVLAGVPGQTANHLRVLLAEGDANSLFAISSTAALRWGPGEPSILDVTLERFAAAFLKINGGFVYTQVASPSAPGANLNILYAKSDGQFYTRAGAAGAETAIGGTNVTDPLVAQVFG